MKNIDITADDIIQEHKEQEIIQCFIDAESTDEQIEFLVGLVDAGLDKNQIAQVLLATNKGVN